MKLIAAANTNTGIHQPCEAVTNSAVNGPHRIPGIVAYESIQVRHRRFNILIIINLVYMKKMLTIVFETANVTPA